MRLDLDMLAALIKARALDLFARQIREVDGRALPAAARALPLHLTPRDGRAQAVEVP